VVEVIVYVCVCVCVYVCVCVCVWLQGAGGGDDVCVIYAELTAQLTADSDSQHHKQVLVCGRQTGHRLVYSSSTENQLIVAVHASPASSHPVYFMLEFDGLSYITSHC